MKRACARAPNRRYGTAGPLSRPARGALYPSRTAQISTVLRGFFDVMGKASKKAYDETSSRRCRCRSAR
jgi:hypothetical protein